MTMDVRSSHASSGRDALALETNLTPRQLLIWLEQQLAPDVPSSNTLCAFRFEVELDSARFARAFRSVVARSDALRTVFETRDGVPQQRVLSTLEVDTEVLDFSRSPDPEAAFATWSDARRQRRFELERGCIDSALVTLGPKKWIWHLAVHHLITDAWSFSLIHRHTIAAYLSGECPELPQFAEYREHTSRRQASPDHLVSTAFWRARLAEPLAPLRFYGRSSAQHTPYFERRSLRLSLERTEALRRIATAEWGASDAAMATVFVALAFAFVHRISGERRLGVGVPFVNRYSKQHRETIGPFLEVCPLRAEIDPDETFASLLGKAQQELIEVLPHASHCVGNASRNREFEVSLNFHTASFESPLGSTAVELLAGTTGIGADSVRVAEGLESAEGECLIITIDDFARGGALRIDLDMNSDVFDAARRELAVQHFQSLLDAFIASPEREIASVPLALPSAPAPRHPRALHMDAPRPATIDDAPSDDRELQLSALWQEVLELPEVGRHASFFDLGGDSLLAVRLLGRIRRAFATDVSAKLLFEHPSVAGFAAALAKGCGNGPSLVPLQARGTATPIFFLCGIHLYHQLAIRLGADQPSYGIFIPADDSLLAGVDGHAPRLTVASMATDYLAVIRTRQPHGPYRLAGISFGGVLAFEVAQRLRAEGESVELLALMEALLPRAHRRSWSDWASAHLAPLLRLDAAPLRARLRGAAGRLRERLPSPLSKAAAPSIEEVRSETYYRAMAEYDPQIAPYPGSIVFFAARDREQSRGFVIDALGGWGDIVRGQIDVVDVPGDHLGILQPPSVDVVASALRRHLAALVEPRAATATRRVGTGRVRAPHEQEHA